MIVVSTDGSCLRNPGGAIGWAWVDHAGGSASGGSVSGTNQIAELRAIYEAISAHPGAEPLLIESDSQYAIKCSTEWLPGWKRKGWKTSSGAPVKNVELIRAIDTAITDREGPVRMRWVRGHVGDHFNEMADTLAGEAARRARETGGDVGEHTPIGGPATAEAARAEPARPARPTPTEAPAPAPNLKPAPEPVLEPAADQSELTLF